jgi:PIN domain nuclease of toxin-antitoxin system
VRFLIDTHVLLWAVGEPARLRPELREALLSPANLVLVSAATAWEIAIKQALGRLSFPLARFDAVLAEAGFAALPISPAHAIEAGGLPRHHGDPVDRMLVAQARIDDLLLASEDPQLAAYQVRRFGARGAV